MASPIMDRSTHAGWSARQLSGPGREAPSTVERKRRGRGADMISLPTPPQNRQNTQLPTPETVRHPRKAAKDRLARSPEVKFDRQAQAEAVGLPTPQTLPRKRTSGAHHLHDAAPFPSGQTTFVHTVNGGSSHASAERSARRRPGLTFAQQMGLLSTGHQQGSGRSGVGVGMGGGHKAGAAGAGHRPVDLIMAPERSKAHAEADARTGEEEDNPFYVPPLSRKTVAVPGGLLSPRRSSRQPINHRTVSRTQVNMMKAGAGVDQEDEDDEDDMAGPSSPLAGRSPAVLHSPAHLVPPPQPNFAAGSRTRTRDSKPSSPALVTPSTPRASTSSALPRPPAFASPVRRSPRQLAKAARLAAMRDEDHNPFLAGPGEVHLAQPAPDGEDESDRAYVTYVFRGTKKVFANPFLPPDVPFPPARLHIMDEEYEDHPGPKPKLLWPTAPIVDKQSTTQHSATPSPPTSPVMRTPRTNRTRGRFLNADRSLEGFDPPAEVYTDSEDERERAGVSSRAGGTQVGLGRGRRAQVDVREHEAEEEEGEEGPTVRRGLLFGPSAMTTSSAVKRVGEDGLAEVKGKKPRTLRV